MTPQQHLQRLQRHSRWLLAGLLFWQAAFVLLMLALPQVFAAHSTFAVPLLVAMVFVHVGFAVNLLLLTGRYFDTLLYGLLFWLLCSALLTFFVAPLPSLQYGLPFWLLMLTLTRFQLSTTVTQNKTNGQHGAASPWWRKKYRVRPEVKHALKQSVRQSVRQTLQPIDPRRHARQQLDKSINMVTKRLSVAQITLLSRTLMHDYWRRLKQEFKIKNKPNNKP